MSTKLIEPNSKPVVVIKCIDTGMQGFYGQYTGRSLGRVIHFLYDVYGCIRADSFTVGDGVVKWGRDIIATYVWIDDTDIPRFTFHSGYRSYDKKQEETIKQLLEVSTNGASGHN